jgi:hypothetical protein
MTTPLSSRTTEPIPGWSDPRQQGEVMSQSKSPRRLTLLFSLTLLLGSSPTWAMAPGWGDLAGEWGRSALRWLAGSGMILPGGESLGKAPKHGCSINPDGKPYCEPVAPKSGCSINPDGKPVCVPVTPKSGCTIDPNGKPYCVP